MIRSGARALLRPVFDRLEARIGPVDARVDRLEHRVDALATPAPVDARAAVPDDVLSAWIDERFRASANGGPRFYEPLAGMLKAAHERRIELLGELPLPPLEDAVCVDYGVGSWGFACIFPRLQHCRHAIGIDISQAAIDESERISATGQQPYGDRYQYLTSVGTSIALPDGSADVVFAGEAIEHVEDTPAFVDEVHRILRPGGTFIVTTPNADAELYKARGERYCVGPEHTALMSYDELVALLAPSFELVVAKGYCASRYPDVDDAATSDEEARALVHLHEDRPDLASNIVCLFRRRDGYRAAHHEQRTIDGQSPELRRLGRWETVPLAGPMHGIRAPGESGEQIEVEAPADDAILLFWEHPWGGIAEIEAGGARHEVDLYGPVGGFRRVLLRDLGGTRQRIAVRSTGRRNPASQACQVIFFRACLDTAEPREGAGA